MRLTAQHIFDSTIVLAQIIREKRPMPQKAKFLIGRMHSKLLAEFNPISAQRDELIKAYDFHHLIQKAAHPDGSIELGTDESQYSVPPDKIAEFTVAWGEIAATEIEVAIDPIPLAALCLAGDANGAIEAHELQSLGDLVTE